MYSELPDEQEQIYGEGWGYGIFIWVVNMGIGHDGGVRGLSVRITQPVVSVRVGGGCPGHVDLVHLAVT